ncbi:S-layer protein [Haloferax volcanii]|nr:S-layer protein [Haloferax lucentense]
MVRNKSAILLCVLVVTSIAAVPVSAESSVYGNPELSLSVSDNTYRSSEAATLSVVASNNGRLEQGGPAQYEQEVQTAQSVEMEILEEQIDAPIDVKTGTVTAGSIPDSGTARFDFNIELGNAEPGTYEIPVEVQYKYVRMVTYGSVDGPEYTWRTVTREKSVTVEVEDRPQFEVVSEGNNAVFAGDTGQLSFALENTGTRTATSSSVQLTTQSPTIFFGTMQNPQSSTSLYVPTLEPGERTNLSVQVGAAAETQAGEYPVNLAVSYQNQNGVTETSDTLTTGIAVNPERSFEIRDIETERFRVDEGEAKINAQVVNTGSGTANNLAVQIGNTALVTPTNGESAIGDLAPGESKPVSFTVSIPAGAEPGTNTFPFVVEYENQDGDVRTTSPIRKSIAIEPEQDPFTVVGVNTSVSPGATDTVDVTVQYNGEEPVSATNAKLFVSDPISTSDDGAYLGEMQPGETKTATFTVSAGSSAVVKAYDASVEVRYDEADGDTRYTDGLPVGIALSPSSGGLPVPMSVLGVVALLGIGAIAVIYRRR